MALVLPLVTAVVLAATPARAQFASGLYVSNVNVSGIGEVDYVPPSNATPTPVVTGLAVTGGIGPTGIGFSANSQYMYVAEAATDTLNVYQNVGGSAALINTISLGATTSGSTIGSSSPADLTVDSSGNVFIAMHDQATGNDSILQVQNAATAPTVSVFLPQGIALASGLTSANGNLYLGLTGGFYGTDTSGGKLFQVTSGGAVSQFPNASTPLGNGNAGLTTDGTYLYVATSAAPRTGNVNAIEKINLSNGAVTPIATNLPFTPSGITMDNHGNLYYDDSNLVTATGGGDVYEIAGAAGITSPVTPTLYNNSLEASENANGGPTYLAYTPGPPAPGTPEPGSLAMSGVVVLLGLAGFGWKRRRRNAAQENTDSDRNGAVDPL
jgi:MYXO-CTERM domain-containing protein